MRCRHGTRWRVSLILSWLALLVQTHAGRAAENLDDLKARIEQGNKEIEELNRRLEARQRAAAARSGPNGAGEGQPLPAKIEIEEAALKKIVADYLRANPGVGMPSSVQTGYFPGAGFAIRSAPAPQYVKWDDECKIPFELRFKARLNLDYDFYKVTDNLNHQTGQRYEPAVGDFSQLEVKRLRMIWEGTAFTPDLRYYLELDGSTRGLGGNQNNKVITNRGTFAPNGAPFSPLGGGVQVDHAIRLFASWVAYDFHPCCAFTGCGPDGQTPYSPTFTLIGGKMKPLFGLEEYLSYSNNGVGEYSMADWYLDHEDDNLMDAAGFEFRAFDDRLYLQGLITNGNESLTPNVQQDDLPGIDIGFWYDFGGTWDEARHRWQLFGESLSDLEYRCCPVLRAGAAVNLVWMGRRSLYGDGEQSRVFVMPAAPGGTRLINMLNGDSLTPNGAHAVDSFDSYSYNAFLAGKYRGFNLCYEWWVRNLDHFKSAPAGSNNIIYQDTLGPGGASVNALFPGHGLLDFGMTLLGGYFIVPRKLQVVARWSWISGESGDINGKGTFTTRVVPGVGPVNVVDGAFRQFHEADEYAVGINYYFKGQALKWSNDLSFYRGGNPAGGAVSPANFIPGVDGWLLRTRIQFMF